MDDTKVSTSQQGHVFLFDVAKFWSNKVANLIL